MITGGGSGIGRGLAEALHKQGNRVVITGRRRAVLDEVVKANGGMTAVTLDIDNPQNIAEFGQQMAREFPLLNVVIHNAGIMKMEDLKKPETVLETSAATISTNVLGPIRLTAALLPLLQRQPHSTIMTVTSGLAFVPLTLTPTYCASKAAIHSWTLSLRYQLRDTTTEVKELIPPYVQTELTGPAQATDPRAMPLADYIAEVMKILNNDPSANEICVERVKPLRFATDTGKFDATFNGLNEAMADRAKK